VRMHAKFTKCYANETTHKTLNRVRDLEKGDMVVAVLWPRDLVGTDSRTGKAVRAEP